MRPQFDAAYTREELKRVDDIEGMYTVLQTGLDFDAIKNEIDVQAGELDSELFVTYVNGALGEMGERFGATTPLHGWMAERTTRVYEEIAVLQALEEGDPTPVSELHERIELDEPELANALTCLEQKGAIERDGRGIVCTGSSV